MANQRITWEEASAAVALQTYNNSKFLQNADTQYARDWEGSKFGETIQIRKPIRYLSFDGRALGSQDSVSPKVNLDLNIKKHVPMKFGIDEMTTSLEEFTENHARPAGERLANDFDAACATACATQVYNSVGTVGAGGPNSLRDLLDVRAKLGENATPVTNPRELAFLTDFAGSANLVDSLKGALNTSITEGAFEAGFIGQAGGMMIGEDQNIVRHTVGDFSGTMLVNGATAEGATSVVFDGAGADVAGFLKAGDVVTFAGVNSVNPISKEDTGSLQQFVVTADVTTAASAGTIPVSPALIAASVGTKNITALPADDAPITVLGTAGAVSSQSVGFHSRAIALATVPLELPAAPDAARANYKGVSVMMSKSWDPNAGENIVRVDVLGGVIVAYPEHACRLWG